jgi:hypothetical protein
LSIIGKTSPVEGLNLILKVSNFLSGVVLLSFKLLAEGHLFLLIVLQLVDHVLSALPLTL